MSLVKRQAHYRLQERVHSPLLILLAALSLLLTGSWLAFKQSPQPDPFASKTLSDRFLYPLESNAFQRLAKISIDLHAVFSLPDSQSVWAVGNAGLIIHSSDGGVTWRQQRYPAGQMRQEIKQTEPLIEQRSLLDSFLNDAQAGIVSSEKKPTANSTAQTEPVKQRVKQAPPVQNTLDLQRSLKKQKTPADGRSKQMEQQLEEVRQEPPKKNRSSSKPRLSAVYFIDASQGWIVGDRGTVLHSSDGGTTWQRQNSGTGVGLSSVTFSDAQHGWAVGNKGIILQTQNGGVSWQRQNTVTSLDLYAVTFTDRQRGWVVGDNGVILHSVDGGLNWRKQNSGLNKGLAAVTFIDARQGWAVGQEGTILQTTDGGDNWRLTMDNRSETLFSVAFADHLHGWIVGENGVILHTADGGISWLEQGNATRATLSSIQFTDVQHGQAVGNNGVVLYTTDGGASWLLQSRNPYHGLAAVNFIDRQQGWAVGSGGIILHSPDGGISGRSQKSLARDDLYSVSFTDTQSGWVAGENGVILHTADGGASWRRQNSGTDNDLHAVTFIAALQGWAVGRNGAIIHTSDAGISWQRQNSGIEVNLNAVTFIDALQGWAVGERNIILHTADGGVSWRVQKNSLPAAVSLKSVVFVDSRQGWVAGNGILHTTDGGVTWQERGISFPGLSLFNSVIFIDKLHGWVAGDSGDILHTVDGGVSWRRQDSGNMQSFDAIAFSDELHGWAVGAADTILYTTDGGKTWSSPVYKKYPAGWYYLLCLIVLGFIYWASAVRQKPQDKQQSIADLLASDRPLQSGDPDPLGFTEIARGLSRFVRNPRTEPPLTIAVTGEWGTGKSSLMNLLYEDLRDKGFSTVWFNAWHHQKSEQLLATLFANMRRQAIPGWLRFSGFRPVGLLFRLRLLLHRSRRHWLLLLLMVFLFSAALAYILEESGHFSQLLNWLDSNLTELSRQVKIVFALGATSATLLPLFVFFRSLRGFALNPLKLMTIHSAEGKKAGSIDPGARYQFAREFRDVTSSLDLGRMIIFIDDLDRCAKENVLEVLEAINFLVSSGSCYIILGMARDWVQICVGLGFKELATESFSNNRGDAEVDPVEHRRRFAMQYLEKMINIEVPVPVLDESKARLLTLPESKQVDMSASGRIQSIIDRYLNIWPVLAFLMMIGLGTYIGLEQELPELKAPAMKKSQPEIISIWPAADLDIVTEQGGRLLLRHTTETVKAAATPNQTVAAV